VQARPESAAGFYELARIYNDEKNPEKAAESIKKALDLDPKNKWYKEAYANILAGDGNNLEAADIFAGLSKSEPQDPSYPLMAAEYYERAKKYSDALTYLDIALARNNSDEDILMHKAQLYLSMNDVDKAAEVVHQLIAKDPSNGKYYKLLGELYDNNKMPEKAAEAYKLAEKKLPNDAAVQLGLAEHYLKTGDSVSYKADVKKAITNLNLETEDQLKLLSAFGQSIINDSVAAREELPLVRTLLQQHPNDPMVLAFYGEIMENNNQRDSAAAAYKKSIEIKPGNFSVWGKLLGMYLDRPYADSLIRYSAKAMRNFPNQAVVHYYNGIGHLNKQNYPVAIKAFNRAIDLQPESDKSALALMYSTLGEAYHSNKQYDLSDGAYEKSLQLEPNNETVLNNYSYYLSERGAKLDEAEKMSKKSLELRPGEATFMDTYGWILYKKGDYEKARTYVQKAIDAAGAHADATLYNHLGDIYYKLGNKEKALENWKLAKSKGGDDSQLDKKITEGKLYE
jgi:tetratricopeptide (TPR) repeat protein